jgi:hypothetical protein
MYQTIRFTLHGAALSLLLSGAGFGQAKGQIDSTKTAVVLPFDSSVKGSVGLPEATRTAVALYLKDSGIFAGVLTSEEAQDKEKNGLVNIGATLSDFAAGNMATRVIVGLGAGRAHAGFDFVIKDAGGATIWQKHIKETASFWSNSASSASQRLELPEKIAKTLVKELQKVRAR